MSLDGQPTMCVCVSCNMGQPTENTHSNEANFKWEILIWTTRFFFSTFFAFYSADDDGGDDVPLESGLSARCDLPGIGPGRFLSLALQEKSNG